MEVKRITTPFREADALGMKSGDKVLLSGYIYTARDAAHRRFVEALHDGQALPVDVADQIIYYCGPTPPRPGRVIGAAGPTTSSRMDSYTPELLSLGMRGMIGKGKRSPAVRKALGDFKAVYFGATGGAGALLSRAIVSYEVVAYGDLGTEAVARVRVVDLPLFVVDDCFGNDLYEAGASLYRAG
jgi:fumarate hydratase subunit beta